MDDVTIEKRKLQDLPSEAVLVDPASLTVTEEKDSPDHQAKTVEPKNISKYKYSSKNNKR